MRTVENVRVQTVDNNGFREIGPFATQSDAEDCARQLSVQRETIAQVVAKVRNSNMYQGPIGSFDRILTRYENTKRSTVYSGV